MNSEERERLKQIQVRSESRKRVAGKFAWAKVSTQEWADIDFLLAQLDSQADEVNQLRNYNKQLIKEITAINDAARERDAL